MQRTAGVVLQSSGGRGEGRGVLTASRRSSLRPWNRGRRTEDVRNACVAVQCRADGDDFRRRARRPQCSGGDMEVSRGLLSAWGRGWERAEVQGRTGAMGTDGVPRGVHAHDGPHGRHGRVHGWVMQWSSLAGEGTGELSEVQGGSLNISFLGA